MLFSFINNLEIPNEKKMLGTLTFGTLGFLYVLCNNDLSEIFFWYTGSFGYTLPLSFVFLSISCYMNYERKERNSTLILGSICAIVAAGGALNITALLCALLLMGILYNKIVCKQVKKNIIIGITALIGAIINVIAPGNYVRHAVIDSKIRPLFSICTTLLRVNHVIAIELQKGFLLFVIVIAFIFAYKNSQHSSVKFRYPVLITLYGYFALIITDFPVILGYSSSANLPGRCTFVESVSTIIFFICVIAYWGGWAAQKNIFQFTAVSFLLIALICSMPLFKYFDIYTLTDLTPYKMVYHIFCGDYKTELERELSIINQIENSTENEVTVCIAKPKDEEWTNLKKIGLSEDSTFWVNDALADYYSKNAIILQYIEQ